MKDLSWIEPVISTLVVVAGINPWLAAYVMTIFVVRDVLVAYITNPAVKPDKISKKQHKKNR